ELEQQLRTRGVVLNAELERDLKQPSRLVECQRLGRSPGGQAVVPDRSIDIAERGRCGEMMGQVGQCASRSPIGRLPALTDAQMQLRAPDSGETVVDGTAHQLVRESIRQPVTRQLLDDP